MLSFYDDSSAKCVYCFESVYTDEPEVYVSEELIRSFRSAGYTEAESGDALRGNSDFGAV